MDKKIRIALSGIGNRALPRNAANSNWLGWVELIKRSEHFELVAAHDPSQDSLGRIVSGAYLKSPQVYQDLDSMLKTVPCDALLVCNPVEYHGLTIRKALDRGLHLLVEKPFVNDLVEGEGLVRLAEKEKKVIAVIQNWRTKDVGRSLYEAIESGLIGRVGSVFFRYIRDRENPNYPKYIFEEKHPLLYAMGIHHLDLFRYILRQEYLSVSGHSFKPAWSLYKSDTGVNLFFKTGGGTSVIYSGTISSANRVIPQESLVIEGEKGTLHNESQWSEPPLWFYPKAKAEKVDLTKEVKSVSTNEQYNISDERILNNFYHSVIGDEKPICDAGDALRSVAAVEASRLACESGKAVDMKNVKTGKTPVCLR